MRWPDDPERPQAGSRENHTRVQRPREQRRFCSKARVAAGTGRLSQKLANRASVVLAAVRLLGRFSVLPGVNARCRGIKL